MVKTVSYRKSPFLSLFVNIFFGKHIIVVHWAFICFSNCQIFSVSLSIFPICWTHFTLLRLYLLLFLQVFPSLQIWQCGVCRWCLCASARSQLRWPSSSGYFPSLGCSWAPMRNSRRTCSLSWYVILLLLISDRFLKIRQLLWRPTSYLTSDSPLFHSTDLRFTVTCNIRIVHSK